MRQNEKNRHKNRPCKRALNPGHTAHDNDTIPKISLAY